MGEKTRVLNLLIFIKFFYDFFVSVRNDLTFINFVKIGKVPPENVNVIIEIPKGSNIKYEIDIESGLLLVDRKLPTSMVYPFNYGFIPMTRDSNGDPVDVFILGDDPLLPMSIILAHPLGILLTEDQDGQDSKIIAAPVEKVGNTYSALTDLTSISIPIRNKLEHFIQHHKDLEEGKYVNIIGWENKNVAEKMITEAIESYRRIAREHNS